MLEGGGWLCKKYVSALEKNVGGVGLPKYFMEVKKCLGGGVRPIYFRGLIKCWGGGGYAKIIYGLENITRTANYMQLICSMLICQKNPWFDATISLLKSSRNLSYACRIGHICRFESCSLILSTFCLCYLNS